MLSLPKSHTYPHLYEVLAWYSPYAVVNEQVLSPPPRKGEGGRIPQRPCCKLLTSFVRLAFYQPPECIVTCLPACLLHPRRYIIQTHKMQQVHPREPRISKTTVQSRPAPRFPCPATSPHVQIREREEDEERRTREGKGRTHSMSRAVNSMISIEATSRKQHKIRRLTRKKKY